MEFKYFASAILFLFFLNNSTAQDWKSRAARGDNFYDIVDATESYYAKHGAGKASGYKQYMRWARRNAPRVYPSGNLVNDEAIRYKAYRKARRSVEQSGDRVPNGHWENIGPFDYYSGGGGSALGRVNRITFHPTDQDVYWVCSAAGGLWRTDNDGSSWTPLTDHFASIGLSGMCVDPTDVQIQYVLTGDGDGGNTRSIGVMKSVNGGVTWSPTGLSWDLTAAVNAYNLGMKADNPSVLIATTTAGLYRTADAGDTWSKVDSSAAVYWDIEFAPDDPETIYVSCSEGILISTNGGLTWTEAIDPDMPADSSFTRLELAVSPADPGVVYGLYGGGPTGFAGLLKSEDHGSTFSLMSNTPNIMGLNTDGSGTAHQAGYDIALAVDPADAEIVYVGGINVWKSEDSGLTWEAKTDWRRIIPFIAWIHADQHELEFRGSTLYAVNDGGVYFSENGATDWTEVSAGLSITQFYYIDVHDNDYVGGTQDNGTNGANVTDPQMTNILDGDGFAAIYHTGDHSIQYLTNQNNKVRRQFGSNVTITPGGLTPSGSQFLFWDEDMDMHTSDPDYVFIANWELYKGNGSGLGFTWDTMFTTFSCTSGQACRITTITQGEDNDDIMYLSNEQEILRSDNINAATPSWTTVTNPSGNAITDIIVDPNDATRIWASTSGYNATSKVYYSDDSGMTWTNQTGSLPNVPANCLYYQPGTNDGIYVGTDIGVYYKNNDLGDWIYFSNGLPNTIVTDMEIDNGYLYAGTYGRGIWRSELYATCIADLILTPANDPSPMNSTGIQVYHASNSIQSTRIVAGGIGTDVEYNAGNYIDLIPGFWAQKGNLLKVSVNVCPE